MVKFTLALVGVLSIAQQARCWGSLGHRTVAYLAEKYLTVEGSEYLSTLLQQGEDISDAALWADDIKRQRGWGFASAWHYIDAQDDPPRSCGVRYNRDCIPSEGCVVSAITNMTSRALNPNLSSSAHYQALKFLIHFIGDIHQPLHTENEARGGNDLHVRFNNRNTNLHAIWDTDILEKHAGPGPKSAEKEDAQAWAETLFSNAASNPSLNLADGDDCLDVSTGEDCALQWANEANSYICSYVLKDDVQGVEGKNLAGKYYEGAVPIVDYLVGKAGFRLGSWINGIAAQAQAQAQSQAGEGSEEL